MSDLENLQFDAQGLIPAIVQDWRDGTVLMVGFMNREAVTKTLETGRVHFWSRSRQRLWEKGETSGNRLVLKDVFVDCDRDTLLVKADAVGPTCHTGERSCFFARPQEDGQVDANKTYEAHGALLEAIHRTIMDRKISPTSGSYVSSLFEGGQDRILKKVAEEAGEVLLASKNGKPDEIIHEVADLIFHTLVLLGYHDLAPRDVQQELAQRFGRSGIRLSGKGEGRR